MPCGRALDTAAAAALAGLPRMSVDRLRALLATAPAADAWADVRGDTGLAEDVLRRHHLHGRRLQHPGEEGDVIRVARCWVRAARQVDLRRIARANQAAGVVVHVLGDPGYPFALRSDHEAPAVLFSRGDVEALAQPMVAVVGTRSATHYGEDVAAELGRDLAQAGVVVVSGLAAGIDGAAHRGALAGGSAPPVGVVASGLDVVYPPRHARLWGEAATRGALLSEAPLGTAPSAWRFPLRNRIIAAIAQVVVVVECHRVGGALHTVEAAVRRGVPILAVPGSVRSPASEGTNALLADGCQPVRGADDVLAALDLERTGRAVPPTPAPGLELSEDERAALTALGWQPTLTDEVMRRTGMPLDEVAIILERLEESGLIRRGAGWWERAAAR
jgi:DNA processing protein